MKYKLRRFKENDVKDFLNLYKDPVTQKGMITLYNTPRKAREEVLKYIREYKKKIKTEDSFVIEVDEEFAGFAGLSDLNEKYFWHKGNIYYCLSPKFRGKGLATKILKEITKYAFKTYPKLVRIEGWCRTYNKASARVLEKAGYKLEAVLKKNKFVRGKYLDDMVWAKVK